MKRSILRFGAIAMATAGLAVGVAAASSASIGTTGPDSHNSVKDTTSNHLNIDNANSVGVSNGNNQGSSTGDAKVKENTTGGDATTGDASNTNTTSTDVSTSGSSCGCTDLGSLFGNGGGDNTSSISNTGPDSHNTVEISSKNDVKIENKNNVSVTNSNYQNASSGDASVIENTTGGNATSGNATNDNNTTTSVSL